MRASRVLVWHAAQDNHFPLFQAGVLQLSVTGRCPNGPVIKQPWNSRCSDVVPCLK
jgi:hypothetical protein